VSSTIKLNNKTRGMANEIHDVCAHRNLSTKAQAIEMMRLQISPEQLFGPRHRLAEPLCFLTLSVAYEGMGHVPPPHPSPQAGEGAACGTALLHSPAYAFGSLTAFYERPNSLRTSAAPATMACILAKAEARERYFMPQSGAITRRSAGT
jgi:hypothetical protein